jgi:hypothetical protein
LFFLNFSPNPSTSSLTNPDSPSPISSQNSTSGDDNSIYNRNQLQQKEKGIRNSLGRLFARKPDFIDQKPIRENTNPSPSITRDNEMTESTTGTLLSLGKTEFDRRIKKK